VAVIVAVVVVVTVAALVAPVVIAVALAVAVPVVVALAVAVPVVVALAVAAPVVVALAVAAAIALVAVAARVARTPGRQHRSREVAPTELSADGWQADERMWSRKYGKDSDNLYQEFHRISRAAEAHHRGAGAAQAAPGGRA
jgi:hypothetical protein